jgi:4-amino-4-deoxy-L-arabinose transferase-like glycosyltransferase
LAYLGAALAFETKGLPAAAFAGTSMLFLLFNPWKKVPFKNLFEPFSLIVSVLVAFSWFILMYLEHGSVYLSSFFADQVGERVSSKTAQFFGNSGLGVVNLFAFLIPWIFIFFSQPRKLKSYISSSIKEEKAIFGFIFTWLILVLLMAGAVFKFYDRYLLPIIPLLSILFAFILINIETKFKKTTFWVLLVLTILMITLSILFALFIHPNFVLLIGTTLSMVIIVAYFTQLFKSISIEVLIANIFLLFFFNAFILMNVLLMPNPGKQLLEHLKAAGHSNNQKVYVYGNIRTASNIRIHGKNQFKVISMDTVFTIPETPAHFLVFNEKDLDKLDLENYIVTDGSEEWSALVVEKFPTFLQTGISNIKNSSTKYIIAKPQKR